MSTVPEHYTKHFGSLTKAMRALETGGVTIEDWQRIISDPDFRNHILAAFGHPVDEYSLSSTSFGMPARRLLIDDAIASSSLLSLYLSDGQVDANSFLGNDSFQRLLNGMHPNQRRIVKEYYLFEGRLYPPAFSVVADATGMKLSTVRYHLDRARRAVATHMRRTAVQRVDPRIETDGEGNEYVLSSPDGALERLQNIVDNPTVPPGKTGL